MAGVAGWACSKRLRITTVEMVESVGRATGRCFGMKIESEVAATPFLAMSGLGMLGNLGNRYITGFVTSSFPSCFGLNSTTIITAMKLN